MHRLSEAICQKRTELWNHQSWILHHDNPPAHTSMLVCEFFVKNKTVIMPQPPYSPDLATADFFLFLKLKTPMKGKRFATIEEIKKNRNRSCWRYQKTLFRSVSRIAKTHWLKCILSEGGYFEGGQNSY